MVNTAVMKQEQREIFTIHYSPFTIHKIIGTHSSYKMQNCITQELLTIHDSRFTTHDSPFTTNDSPLTTHGCYSITTCPDLTDWSHANAMRRLLTASCI